RFNTAALADEYVTTRESGKCAETLAILIILPLPRATMAGPNSWHGRNTPPTRFKSKFACQASSGIFSNGLSAVAVTLGSLPPAAFTRIVTGPSDFSTD